MTRKLRECIYNATRWAVFLVVASIVRSEFVLKVQRRSLLEELRNCWWYYFRTKIILFIVLSLRYEGKQEEHHQLQVIPLGPYNSVNRAWCCAICQLFPPVLSCIACLAFVFIEYGNPTVSGYGYFEFMEECVQLPDYRKLWGMFGQHMEPMLYPDQHQCGQRSITNNINYIMLLLMYQRYYFYWIKKV